MINIILKLSLVNDMVDLLTDTLNSSVWTNLTNDKFVEPTLSKLKTLINGLVGVCHDVFKLQWSQLSPFLFHSLQSSSRLVIVIAANET